MRRALPTALAKVKPRVFGWFPSGPAAAVAADLASPKKRRSVSWPPPGVEVKEIRTDVAAVCMGLDELVNASALVHPDDDLLNTQIGDTQRKDLGRTWVFGQGESGGPIDAVYAAAGAVHLARMLPAAPRVRRLIVAT
jgi:hypothetical protein